MPNNIRRLFLDSLEQLNKLGGRMKNKVQVSFVNSEGLDEAGIDGGGVFKEFMGGEKVTFLCRAKRDHGN